MCKLITNNVTTEPTANYLVNTFKLHALSDIYMHFIFQFMKQTKAALYHTHSREENYEEAQLTLIREIWRFSTAWYGTVRHGTAQFGSVCVSTAV